MSVNVEMVSCSGDSALLCGLELGNFEDEGLNGTKFRVHGIWNNYNTTMKSFLEYLRY